MFPSLVVDPKRDLNFCKAQIIISDDRGKLTVWLALLLYQVPACRFF